MTPTPLLRRAIDRACVRVCIWAIALMSDQAAWQLSQRIRGYWTGERGQRVLRDLHAGRD